MTFDIGRRSLPAPTKACARGPSMFWNRQRSSVTSLPRMLTPSPVF
jgi:hypothetical protein